MWSLGNQRDRTGGEGVPSVNMGEVPSRDDKNQNWSHVQAPLIGTADLGLERSLGVKEHLPYMPDVLVSFVVILT